MKDSSKTKQELIEALSVLTQKIKKLENQKQSANGWKRLFISEKPFQLEQLYSKVREMLKT